MLVRQLSPHLVELTAGTRAEQQWLNRQPWIRPSERHPNVGTVSVEQYPVTGRARIEGAGFPLEWM